MAARRLRVCYEIAASRFPGLVKEKKESESMTIPKLLTQRSDACHQPGRKRACRQAQGGGIGGSVSFLECCDLSQLFLPQVGEPVFVISDGFFRLDQRGNKLPYSQRYCLSPVRRTRSI